MMGCKMQAVALVFLVTALAPCMVVGQGNLFYGYTPQELDEFIGRTVRYCCLVLMYLILLAGLDMSVIVNNT